MLFTELIATHTHTHTSCVYCTSAPHPSYSIHNYQTEVYEMKDYVLLRQLGDGTFGCVHLGKHRVSGDTVAIKM